MIIPDVGLLEAVLHLLLGLLKLLIYLEEHLIDAFLAFLDEVAASLGEGLCRGVYLRGFLDQLLPVADLFEVFFILVDDILGGVREELHGVFRALLLILAAHATLQHAGLAEVDQLKVVVGTHVVLQGVNWLRLLILLRVLRLVNNVLSFIEDFKREFKRLLHIY